MVNDITDRARWLYAANGGAYTKDECVRKAIQEKSIEDLAKKLQIFDITIDEYIKYIAGDI